METEGMQRALRFLEGKAQISEIVTDASRSIMALPGMFVILGWKHNIYILQYRKRFFKLLPLAGCMAQVKKTEKIIAWTRHWVRINLALVDTTIYKQVSKSKGMEKVGMWADQIVNHFWWWCWMCERDEEQLKVWHDLEQEYKFQRNVSFKRLPGSVFFTMFVMSINGKQECVHDEHIVDGDHIPYFNKKDKDFEALQKLVLNVKWLESLKY